MTANGKRMGDNAEAKNKLWSDRSLNNTHCRSAMRRSVHRSGLAFIFRARAHVRVLLRATLQGGFEKLCLALFYLTEIFHADLNHDKISPVTGHPVIKSLGFEVKYV